MPGIQLIQTNSHQYKPGELNLEKYFKKSKQFHLISLTHRLVYIRAIRGLNLLASNELKHERFHQMFTDHIPAHRLVYIRTIRGLNM